MHRMMISVGVYLPWRYVGNFILVAEPLLDFPLKRCGIRQGLPNERVGYVNLLIKGDKDEELAAFARHLFEDQLDKGVLIGVRCRVVRNHKLCDKLLEPDCTIMSVPLSLLTKTYVSIPGGYQGVPRAADDDAACCVWNHFHLLIQLWGGAKRFVSSNMAQV